MLWFLQTPLKALQQTGRRARCRLRNTHCCDLQDLTHRDQFGNVSCRCLTCDTVLTAPYGLALNCYWVRTSINPWDRTAEQIQSLLKPE